MGRFRARTVSMQCDDIGGHKNRTQMGKTKNVASHTGENNYSPFDFLKLVILVLRVLGALRFLLDMHAGILRG